MASKARITTDESRAPFSPRAALVRGGAAALAVAALWVALTATTGKTYHLAPPVIAWLPGLAVSLARRNSPGSAPPPGGLRLGLLASACGVALVAAGWVTISVVGVTPSATVFHGQPGGVHGEVAATTFVGALLGTRRVARAR